MKRLLCLLAMLCVLVPFSLTAVGCGGSSSEPTGVDAPVDDEPLTEEEEAAEEAIN